jgi:signal transduction histidine kinase
VEALLMPFYVAGKVVGTVWVIAHDDSRKFDGEDLRIIGSLGQFAAGAFPLCAALDAQEVHAHSMRDVNEGLLVSSLRQHELTEQAQNAEAALREIEERLRLAGAAAKVGTWRIDLVTHLDTRDANLNRLLAREPVDSTQPIEDFLSLIHPDDRHLVEEEIDRAARERGSYKVECRVILPGGSTRWLLNQGEVILSAGASRYVTGAAVDITAQKGVEENLRRANEDLEQFGYSASHDLQEPIRNISVYGELLVQRYGHLLDQQGRDFLTVITAGAKRMHMLLKDLRDYAQSGGGDRDLSTEVHADSVLEKALCNLSWAVLESGAEVSHGELPVLCMQQVQLEQILQNLIGNAIKYRRDDEPPRIHVSATRQQDKWMFCVRDNGIGIADEHRERIFGIFKRLHGGEKYSGSGIGLAICQKLVKGNSGRIWVESGGSGKGSTFCFTLPAGDVR